MRVTLGACAYIIYKYTRARVYVCTRLCVCVCLVCTMCDIHVYDLYEIFLENQSEKQKKKLIACFRIEPNRKHNSSWKRKKLMIRPR